MDINFEVNARMSMSLVNQCDDRPKARKNPCMFYEVTVLWLVGALDCCLPVWEMAV